MRHPCGRRNRSRQITQVVVSVLSAVSSVSRTPDARPRIPGRLLFIDPVGKWGCGVPVTLRPTPLSCPLPVHVLDVSGDGPASTGGGSSGDREWVSVKGWGEGGTWEGLVPAPHSGSGPGLPSSVGSTKVPVLPTHPMSLRFVPSSPTSSGTDDGSKALRVSTRVGTRTVTTRVFMSRPSDAFRLSSKTDRPHSTFTLLSYTCVPERAHSLRGVAR